MSKLSLKNAFFTKNERNDLNVFILRSPLFVFVDDGMFLMEIRCKEQWAVFCALLQNGYKNSIVDFTTFIWIGTWLPHWWNEEMKSSRPPSGHGPLHQLINHSSQRLTVPQQSCCHSWAVRITQVFLYKYRWAWLLKWAWHELTSARSGGEKRCHSGLIFITHSDFDILLLLCSSFF